MTTKAPPQKLKALAKNTGGRTYHEVGQNIRIISEYGQVSREIYRVEGDSNNKARTDRKNTLLVSLGEGSSPFRVHARRIIDVDFTGAVVLSTTDGISTATCPKCSQLLSLDGVADQCVCNTCGPITLHWLNKPVTGKIKTQRTLKATGSQTEDNAVTKVSAKPTNTVNIEDLLKIENCELWSKRTPFDHARIDTRACILLFTGETPRKLCFNLYDGHTGKNPIPLQQFIANDPGAGKTTWYPVKNLGSAREDFQKKGYEHITTAATTTEEPC